ncbi:FkbM family methyltransferase [Methylocystis sp. ATCC 49242]|uniref:FkbM family methyltransferase n=1 Tax=Methylocystis sp. ATCC 49242 TaxID=622637 RepID=UPI0001F875C3|nr:FkbM family methyltransferase [Methylocystis sp. ATCC 49242]
MLHGNGETYLPDLIYDLGMHYALDTKFYLDKRFRVVSLEANPAFVEAALQEHEAFVQAERLVILNRALWRNSAEKISFYLNPIKDDWSSAFKSRAEKGGHASQEIKVDTITLSQMFDLYGVPYYLKCDMEGADELFVQQLLADSRRPAFVSIEAASLGALAVLFAAGYDLVQIVNQGFNSSLTPPNPAQEGVFVPAHFNGLMSGLFGRELPREGWQSFEDAARDYLAFKELQKHNSPLVHGWMDFHVTSSATLKKLGVIE